MRNGYWEGVEEWSSCENSQVDCR